MRVLIAASGSGGHLLPAVRIAKAIQKQNPDAVCEFVGVGRPLEAKIIDARGFTRHEIKMSGLANRGLKGALEFLLRMPAAILKTWRLLSEFKPDCVVGVGGYVSVFPVVLARLRGIETWIHEAELRPGIANRWLAFFASKISIAFEAATISGGARRVYTGHPVEEALAEVKAMPWRKDQMPRRILITGGSQGSRALDNSAKDLAVFFKERGLEIRHQCRAENLNAVSEAYAAQQVPAQISPFIEDMVEAYAWSEVIVCRAGAGSVMELEVINRPAILVPFPHAQGGHQKANALTLVEKGKAFLLEEGPEFALRLRRQLEEILLPDTYWRMKEAPLTGRSISAAEVIAKGVGDLAARHAA